MIKGHGLNYTNSHYHVSKSIFNVPDSPPEREVANSTFYTNYYKTPPISDNMRANYHLASR